MHRTLSKADDPFQGRRGAVACIAGGLGWLLSLGHVHAGDRSTRIPTVALVSPSADALERLRAALRGLQGDTAPSYSLQRVAPATLVAA